MGPCAFLLLLLNLQPLMGVVISWCDIAFEMPSRSLSMFTTTFKTKFKVENRHLDYAKRH